MSTTSWFAATKGSIRRHYKDPARADWIWQGDGAVHGQPSQMDPPVFGWQPRIPKALQNVDREIVEELLPETAIPMRSSATFAGSQRRSFSASGTFGSDGGNRGGKNTLSLQEGSGGTRERINTASSERSDGGTRERINALSSERSIGSRSGLAPKSAFQRTASWNATASHVGPNMAAAVSGRYPPSPAFVRAYLRQHKWREDTLLEDE